MMNKIAVLGCAILTLVVSTQASSIDVLRDDFLSKIGTDRQKVILSLLPADTNYQKAMEHLNKQPYMLKMPELSFHGQKIEGRYLPDCEKAMPYLVESLKSKANTLSAYLGLHCINNDAFIKKNSELLQKKRAFAESLYANEKLLCTGYLAYGDVLMNGIAGNPDPSKAQKVYEEGKAKCSRFASDWEKKVLDIKIEQARFKTKSPSK